MVCYVSEGTVYWLLSVRSTWLEIGQVLFLRVKRPRQIKFHKHTRKEQGQYPAILTEQVSFLKTYTYQTNYCVPHSLSDVTNTVA